ncbi:hypothetical protein [Streptomyces sp. NPDC007856]|uniref:hypothetical protein n=1 Tax=Streptomyces sp. NPDC007856 TaxID=3364781 RepID=UPI0036AAFD71
MFKGPHMPSLAGAAEWLNTEPLGRPDLRGHTVLVDFGTLTCINWLRTQPYTRAWSQAYRNDGLVVVTVHTPEFSFEYDVDRVRTAVADRGIDYPVAVDNDYAIWNAFDNHYWPALYFVDSDGTVRGRHFGEGSYTKSERLLQRLLGVDRKPVSGSVTGFGVEAKADWRRLRSPETYLGYGRSENLASPDGLAFDEPFLYEVPEYLGLNAWAMEGQWTVGVESVVLNEAGGRIVCRFHARDANLVLCTRSPDPIPFHVRVDGRPPGPSHGVDVDEAGRGLLREGRLYQLIREADSVHERTLEVTFLRPGAEAYAFTFG